jgi:hypothetical protein
MTGISRKHTRVKKTHKQKHKLLFGTKFHLLRPNRKNTWSKSSRLGSTPPSRYWSNSSNKTEIKNNQTEYTKR